MKQYQLTMTGTTPLIMHNDNITFSEKIREWSRMPEHKSHSVAGDDRSPAWTWFGYAYHDGREFGMPSDNLMTMLREGGAKVLTGKGKETFKKHTQSGLIVDQQQFELFVGGGRKVPVAPFKELIGELDFNAHLDRAEQHGFELLVKRAKIGAAKHVRVRPMFREWVLRGSITVLDEKLTGLTREVLGTILNLSGALVGLGDWRPSSPKASGSFGKFSVEIG